ncbi:hypothetical protein FNV43_RR15292 [Rhamnella rubrinervis]|uniref:Disease resistance RPP13-like protein 1 n=1 Tax=Rhamnella rubrinervis TaxID=2594499 RepID=A0A8K0E7I5_9ROSA|nr:hypothetical protein FNV43_RR15292 [Rhamnella rubrinervis]
MALEVVGGAYLSASLQVLFADIHSIIDFFRRKKVDKELLRQLRNKLLLANGVLDDAERQQITKPDVREWLEQLKDAIQKAEDLVDDIKIEADRQMRSRVRNFFSSRFAVKDVELRIQNIIKSVGDIVEDMSRLGLTEGVQTSIPFQIQRSSLNILAKESNVYGRAAEKHTIIKFLLSDGGHKLSVMPIIVSDESKCDVFTLTKAIYEKVTNSTCTYVKETFLLQHKLKEALQGKKFLFILDDVWNVDHEIWDGLQTPFESAANGSKIIVTTRLPEVAKVLVTVDSKTLDLQLLSEADCWLLFSKHAFNNVEPSSYPHLVEIGKKIVEKCGGNPLAVKSLGCLLHSQLDSKEWENVLVNDIWELKQGEGGVLPALWLSYYHFPRHLKRCFAYCSIIPKDFYFPKERLILLWMAQGLLQPENNRMLEEVGEKYFEDLASRSFFLVGGNTFTMHDLVNDLAKYVSGESCLRLDDNCSGNLTRKTRHISLMNYKTSDIRKKLEDLSKNTGLRTLFLLKDCRHLVKLLRSMQYLRVLSFGLHGDFEGQMKLLKSVGRLKHLRYLDLSCNEGMKEIPESIGKLWNLQTLLLRFCKNLHQLPESIVNLKHLRYLDLSDTRIEKIPEIFGNLHELRTLNLSWTRIKKIPDILGNLHELRTLDLPRTRIKKIPDILGNLHELRTLNLSETRIKKIPDTLGNLHELRTLDLNSTRLEKIPDTLGNLHELCTLDLSRTRIRYLIYWLPTNITMLTNLCDLDSFRMSLKEMPLNISNLKNLQRLPEFVVGKSGGIEELGELTNLHGDLRIRSLETVEEVGVGVELKHKNHITHLELEWNDDSLMSHIIKRERVLTFENMGEWKEWSLVGGAFPILERLELRRCPKLKGAGFPDYLPSLNVIDNDYRLSNLKSLEIIECDKLFALGNKWNLGMFTSLRSLIIRDVDMNEVDSFPEKEGQLPTTLTSIELISLRGLKSLNGTALRHLTSLRELDIDNCQQLLCLPEEGLPTSIFLLNIDGCPLLEPRCQRGIGQDWDKIHHILLKKELRKKKYPKNYE